MRRRANYTGAALFGALLLLAACGDDDTTMRSGVGPVTTETAESSGGQAAGSETTESAESGDGQGADGEGSVMIEAEDIAFVTDAVEADAGEIAITFENNDDGVPHNLHLTDGVDAQTEIESGPTTQELTVTIEEPGTYAFVCDVHPQMTGELTVQ